MAVERRLQLPRPDAGFDHNRKSLRIVTELEIARLATSAHKGLTVTDTLATAARGLGAPAVEIAAQVFRTSQPALQAPVLMELLARVFEAPRSLRPLCPLLLYYPLHWPGRRPLPRSRCR